MDASETVEETREIKEEAKPFGRNQRFAARVLTYVGACFVIPAFGVFIAALWNNDVPTQITVLDKLMFFVKDYGIWAAIGAISVAGGLKGIQAGAAAWASRGNPK